jgi:glutathione reductase (NADPH)
MTEYDYDLFCIGAGSGGVRASRFAASMGARVAVAENKYLGGTCVNVGCIPKKLLVYASHFREDLHLSESFGWDVKVNGFNWQKLISNKDKEILRLNGIYGGILEKNGVKVLHGTAKVIDPHTVEVDGKAFTAKNILIATGSWPNLDEIPGKEHIITSNELFHLSELPKSILIAGGGYIAVELAGILNGLGVDVTLIYRGELFLRGFDEEVRRLLLEEMKQKGVKFILGNTIKEIKKTSLGLQVVFRKEGQSQLSFEKVLFAIGRNPNTKGLGLEDVGVELSAKGGVKVDDYFQTNVPSIYAIGDVIDRVMLTPVALAEGMALTKNLFKGEKNKVDYDNIPTAIFSDPPIGTVGLTEEAAREKYGDVEVYTSRSKPLKLSLSSSTEKAFFKLIVDAKSRKVVGFHMLGMDSAEIMQGMGVALKCGATKEQFDQTIGIHPSLAEEFVTLRDKTR